MATLPELLFETLPMNQRNWTLQYIWICLVGDCLESTMGSISKKKHRLGECFWKQISDFCCDFCLVGSFYCI